MKFRNAGKPEVKIRLLRLFTDILSVESHDKYQLYP